MEKKHRYDCRNCGANFTYDELKIKQCDYGGIALQNKVCPYCGSTMWSSTKDRELLKKHVLPSEYADYQRGKLV